MKNRRSASAVLIALVALAAGSMVLLEIVRTASLYHAAAREGYLMRQARWLAEAALQRAQLRREQSSDYSGETWSPPPAAVEPARYETFQAEIQPSDDRRLITIRATVGETPTHRATYLLELRTQAGDMP
jgi:type II secretory pathway component PulK